MRVSAAIANTYSGGPYGVAPNASSYFADWGRGSVSYAIYNGCVANSSWHVWNFSWTSSNYHDRYFDYWVKHSPWPVIATESGNQSQGCSSYGSNLGVTSAAYSTLSVNASDDKNTSDRTDDAMMSCTTSGCYANPCSSSEWCPHGDRELPVISAPGESVSMLGTTVSGTSIASAEVAGIAALVQQFNVGLGGSPDLSTWPEGVRAILLATASNDLYGTYWPDDFDSAYDQRDGAGEVDAYLAVGLSGSQQPAGSAAATQGFDFGGLNFANDCAGSYCTQTYAIKTTNGLGSAPCRVVLVWDATASCTSASDATTCSSDHKDADLDLYLFDNGNLIDVGASWDNTMEIIQFTPVVGHTYTAKIAVVSNAESQTFYGIAWMTTAFHDN